MATQFGMVTAQESQLATAMQALQDALQTTPNEDAGDGSNESLVVLAERVAFHAEGYAYELRCYLFHDHDD